MKKPKWGGLASSRMALKTAVKRVALITPPISRAPSPLMMFFRQTQIDEALHSLKYASGIIYTQKMI